MLSGTQLFNRAAGIRLIIMDVDGVLTDGKLAYTSDRQEIKSFNVKDGLGISLGVKAGIEFGIITARESPMVTRRAADLDIRHVIQKMRTKLPAFETLVQNLSLSFDQVAYIGDDLPDMPCMARAGLAACPADAAERVRRMAHLVSTYRGGDGAVREIIEFILEARLISTSA